MPAACVLSAVQLAAFVAGACFVIDEPLTALWLLWLVNGLNSSITTAISPAVNAPSILVAGVLNQALFDDSVKDDCRAIKSYFNKCYICKVIQLRVV